MSDFDLIIRNTPDLGIKDGKLAATADSLGGTAKEEIDATKLLVMAGAIDAHVHFNEPGRTEWEGLATGSRAAAAGGTTTFFDMPLNAHPPTLDGPSFDLKLAAAEANSVVDFALWGGLVPWNLDEIETLQKRGVIALKAFMSKCGTSDFSLVSPSVLRAGMKSAAQLGMLVAVHAEFDRPELSSGSSVREYCRSRPVIAEQHAIECALDLAGETGCALHIVHVSSGSGVAMIAKAKAEGVNVTCETCPHYLLLTEDDMERLGAVAKCAPPLRQQPEQAHLRKRLLAGEVDTIGSDHSPAPLSMKTDPNFFNVWGGISGCQHLLALLLDAGYELPLLEKLLCGNVANRFRIGDRKAAFTIGADADFILLDTNVEHEIRPEDLHYRHPQTPYVGRKMKTAVVRTILRGKTVYHEGKFTERPFGQFLRPSGLQ